MTAKWLGLFALLLFGSVVAAPAVAPNAPVDAMARIRASNQVILGFRTDSEPFSYLDDHGHPIGYSIDLCELVVDRLRQTLHSQALAVRYVPVTAEDRFAAIQSQRIDLECGATTNTRARESSVAFLMTTFLTGTRVMVAQSSGIESMRALRDHPVAVLAGTTNEAALRERDREDSLNLRIVTAPDRFVVQSMLERGEVAAYVGDEMLLYGLRAAMQDPTRWKIVGDYLSYEPYAIMLSRRDVELKRIGDEALVAFMHAGGLEKLHKKWFDSPIPPVGTIFHVPLTDLQLTLIAHPNDRGAD